MSQLFEDKDGGVRVILDEDDSRLPIAIRIGAGEAYDERWLTGEDATLLAGAIASAFDTVFTPGDGDYTVEVFKFAKAFGRTVTFRYAKGDGGVIEERRLLPNEVREVKGNLLVIGDDPDRDGDVRAYRIDRVKGNPVIA